MSRWLILGPMIFMSLLPMHVFAEDLMITPMLVGESGMVEKALMRSNGRAKTELEGQGSKVIITYSSDADLNIFMIPMNEQRTNYNPTDAFSFLLPAGTDNKATIDLTLSPGWVSARPIYYIIHILTPTAETNAGFSEVEFVAGSIVDQIRAMASHGFKSELFTPATFHVLRGYRIMTTSVTIVLGMLSIITCIIVYIIARKRKWHGGMAILMTLVIFQLLYGARFALDLLRFSGEHLHAWYTTGQYDEAGSIYLIADVIKSSIADPTPSDSGVYICHDGTNFQEKLLRYFLYPVPVSSDALKIKDPSHVLILVKKTWSFDDKTNALDCGEFKGAMKHIKTYDDGSVLFSKP